MELFRAAPPPSFFGGDVLIGKWDLFGTEGDTHTYIYRTGGSENPLVHSFSTIFSMIAFNQCIHICKWIKTVNLPMHMQSLRCPGILELSRKFQDSKIFRVNLGVLEFLKNSKIPRLSLKILGSCIGSSTIPRFSGSILKSWNSLGKSKVPRFSNLILES